jgi:hypothetical protein
MSSPDLESEIDRLYQLPREEFTAARNALARRVGGPEGVRIKSFPKPSFPAWAVNQVYWKKKDDIARVLETRAKLERAQEAVMTGRQADVRKAMEHHRQAVHGALDALGGLLTSAEWTADKQHAVRQVLEGLAADSRPGRLAAEPKPVGFDVFSGIAPEALRPRAQQGPAKERARERPTPRPETPGGQPRRPSAIGPAAAVHSARTVALDASQALAGAKRRLRSAEREARRAQAGEDRARRRREEESSRERRAKDLHEKALRELADAEADLERSRQAAADAARALREAEEEVERVSNPQKRA